MTIKSEDRTNILDVLYTGGTYTASELAELTGASSVSARVLELRNAGYAIYTNRNGYRLGRASERFLRNLSAGRTKIARRSLYTLAV